MLSTDAPMPPPAPRPFRWGAVGAGPMFLLMFGGIWLFVGTLITTAFTAAGGPVWNDVILDRRGVQTQATPLGVEMTGSHVNGRYVQRIRFRFTDGSGAEQTGSAGTTDWPTIARAQSGAPLAIEYDPRAPALARLTGGRASFFGWFVLLPLAFALVGAAIVRAGLRRALRVRTTYVHGEAVRAQVTALAPTAMRVNGRRVMRVDYLFDALTGRVTGQGSSLAPPPVGATIWVLYQPSSPQQSVIA
jgi:hypothetical protein